MATTTILKVTIGAGIAFAIVFGVVTVVFAGPPEMVQICHALGNGTYNLLEIPPSAVDAHMAHGDKWPVDGTCPPDEETGGGDDGGGDDGNENEPEPTPRGNSGDAGSSDSCRPLTIWAVPNEANGVIDTNYDATVYYGYRTFDAQGREQLDVIGSLAPGENVPQVDANGIALWSSDIWFGGRCGRLHNAAELSLLD